jgi:hypothetical protein
MPAQLPSGSCAGIFAVVIDKYLFAKLEFAFQVL